MLHLLIPAAGESRRFAEQGYEGPKGLLKVHWNGETLTMLEHIVNSIDMRMPTVIGCRPPDYVAFVQTLPRCEVQAIRDSTGQADTVAQMAAELEHSDEMLVINSDNVFDQQAALHLVAQSRRTNAIVGALVFLADHERYGFVDGYPFFNAGAEKVPISKYALAGAFYFRSAREVLAAWDKFKKHSSDAERYLSGMFQHFDGPKVSVLIDKDLLHEWGTPESLSADQTVSHIKPTPGA